MITLLLIEKIASLFLIMAVGFALVRCRVLESGQSAVLSKIMLWAVSPCAVIAAFQVELSTEVLHGFLLAVAVGLGVQLFQMAVVRLIARPLHLSGLERMVCVYSNTGNLILPLVAFCLGDEWRVYAIAYMGVQSLFMWTHGKSLIEGKRNIEWKRLLLSINIIALGVGLVLFALKLRLPGPALVFVESLGDLIGPLAMLITGMIVGGMQLKQVVANRRVWLVAAIRLLGLPALVTLGMRIIAGLSPLPDAQSILLIVLLGAVTPTASMSVVFSQEYGTEAPYASAINVVTTIACIVTMPLWVYLYML